MTTFTIKQYSTLPILKYYLSDYIMNTASITEDMLSNVAVTFSMYNIKTNRYVIANVAADIETYDINECKPYRYALSYKFNELNTSSPGTYLAEFKIDFLGDECGKLTLPIFDKINVVIQPTLTRTTVV